MFLHFFDGVSQVGVKRNSGTGRYQPGNRQPKGLLLWVRALPNPDISTKDRPKSRNHIGKQNLQFRFALLTWFGAS